VNARAACWTLLVILWAPACPDTGPRLQGEDVGDAGSTDPGFRRDPGTVDPGTDRGGPADPGGSDPGGQDPGADPGKDAGKDAGAGECQNSGQCALGNICAGATCVPGCEGERDCPTGLHCDPGSGAFGACLACLSDDHCAGLRCILGSCLKPCTGDGECAATPATRHCVDGACAACGQDAHCALGTVCQDRACVAGCRSARDCPEGKTCAVDGGPAGACVDCVTSDDCAGGRVCVAWSCLVDCSRVQCTAEAPVCDPATGQCTAAPCKDECLAGQRVCLVAFPQRIKDCGSFDGDPCLEWGPDRLCPAYQQCVPGGASGAECACANPCTEGVARCIEGSVTARDVCRVQAGTNCRYWSRESCAEGLACTGTGTCQCREDCVAGRYGCNSTYPTTVYRCETDAASGCRYWDPYFVCTDGSQCGDPGCGG
jgi:hypothetical protein